MNQYELYRNGDGVPAAEAEAIKVVSKGRQPGAFHRRILASRNGRQTADRTAATLPMTGHHGREGFLRPKSEGSGSSTRST